MRAHHFVEAGGDLRDAALKALAVSLRLTICSRT
jgi:hypothetical protein